MEVDLADHKFSIADACIVLHFSICRKRRDGLGLTRVSIICQIIHSVFGTGVSPSR